MNLPQVLHNILKSGNLSNIRHFITATEEYTEQDEYVEASNLVQQLKLRCPNVSVVHNCSVNLSIFPRNTGAYQGIGKKNILVENPKMLFQPKNTGKTMMIFTEIQMDERF
jgi:hypothetical protein